MKLDSALRRYLPTLAACLLGVSIQATAQPPETPMTRLQPIGSPSAVDRYRPPPADRTDIAERTRQSRWRETADTSPETTTNWASRRSRTQDAPSSHRQRQFRPASNPRRDPPPTASSTGLRRAVFQQSDRDPVTAPQLPSGGMSFPGAEPPAGVSPLPSSDAAPASPSNIPPPTTSPAAPGFPRAGTTGGDPPSLAPGAAAGAMGSGVAGSGDLTPLPQPQLQNSGFATIDNCSCISEPSSWSAASGIDGGAPIITSGPSTYTPPPAQIPQPAIMPPLTAPPSSTLPAAPTGAPAGSLFSLGQQLSPVEVAPGLWGQPVAYVPGQHFRNWIRYLSP